ncbi:MAG TPA: fused MFS/spermidine synthase [Steroidobacteraceae bacterium]|nr:fused MFS/spermidine synthase [Steroidobacteraceae bacterium]
MTSEPTVHLPRRFQLFALAIFCGSFLLFLIQPIIAKELLPRFGGSASVWLTCLVFFQFALLLGYAGADRFAAVPPRVQFVLVLVLVLAAAVTLPIVPNAHGGALQADLAHTHPALGVVVSLTLTVGLPYVLVSATTPVVQSWYARCLPGRSPYGLFALSNLASMLALFGYPLLLEPWVGTRWQAYGWSLAYLVWAALMLACAAAMRASTAGPAQHEVNPPADPAMTVLSASRQGEWLLLSGLGSWLLLALTRHLTRDVAAIPLLWILPLAVYLLTFILAFSTPRWLTSRAVTLCAVAALLLYAAFTAWSSWPGAVNEGLPIAAQIGVFCAVLAGTCLLCNGGLALLRPPPQQLTRFYLTLSLGGAAGAVLIGLVAPALLNVDFDLEIGMLVCALLVLWQIRRQHRVFVILSAVTAVLVLAAVGLVVQQFYDGTVLARRNFYGTLRVFDWDQEGAGRARSLANGVIVHGTQYLAPALERRPTEYYGDASGIGHAMAALQRDPQSHRIGVIGLGTGTMAAYGRRGDVMRFYEINPQVLDIANREFTFLRDSPARVEVAQGDARLTLASEAPQHFDVLVVDAFTGDAIPVHLLTVEALDLYLRHLQPHGIIAFHVSNLYLDLVPVVGRVAQARRLSARLVEADQEDNFNTASSWVLVSPDPKALTVHEIATVAQAVPANTTRVWTDDFSDMLPFLH